MRAAAGMQSLLQLIHTVLPCTRQLPAALNSACPSLCTVSRVLAEISTTGADSVSLVLALMVTSPALPIVTFAVGVLSSALVKSSVSWDIVLDDNVTVWVASSNDNSWPSGVRILRFVIASVGDTAGGRSIVFQQVPST